MEELKSAPTAPKFAAARYELVEGVLHEVARLLHWLALDPGLAEVIDLRSLPLQEADRALLRQRLGDGEIDATLNLLGPTNIRETAYAGVWWARQMDADDRCALEQIIIARVPPLLLAHPADIDDAARRLSGDLNRAGQAEALLD